MLVSNLKKLEEAFEIIQKDYSCDELACVETKAQIVNLFSLMRKKISEHTDSYPMIHAQDSFFFSYQVIAKELYELKNNQHLSKFKFFRCPNNVLTKTPSEFFNKYPPLYLTQEEVDIELQKDDDERSDRCKINDSLPEISKELIAVNLIPETFVSLDSALFVFLSGGSIALGNNEEEHPLVMQDRIKSIFEFNNISPRAYEPFLKTLLENAPTTNQGIITQIFIPIDKIDKHFYMSFGGGFYRPDQNQNMNEFLANLQKKYKENEFNVKENIQGRLIAGSLFEPYIKMYQYSLIPKVERLKYKKLVMSTLKEILKIDSQVRALNGLQNSNGDICSISPNRGQV